MIAVQAFESFCDSLVDANKNKKSIQLKHNLSLQFLTCYFNVRQFNIHTKTNHLFLFLDDFFGSLMNMNLISKSVHISNVLLHVFYTFLLPILVFWRYAAGYRINLLRYLVKLHGQFQFEINGIVSCDFLWYPSESTSSAWSGQAVYRGSWSGAWLASYAWRVTCTFVTLVFQINIHCNLNCPAKPPLWENQSPLHERLGRWRDKYGKRARLNTLGFTNIVHILLLYD